jgi:membrane protein implicated in regulation of membrane protease activity
VNWLADNPGVAWLALGLLLIGGEALAGTDLWLLMIGVGVLAGAGTLAIGLAVPVALLVTAAVSLLLLFLVRPSVLRRLHSGADLSNDPTGELLGRHCRALGEITEEGGQIRIDGVLWSARPYMPGSRMSNRRTREPGTIRLVRGDSRTSVNEGSAGRLRWAVDIDDRRRTGRERTGVPGPTASGTRGAVRWTTGRV